MRYWEVENNVDYQKLIDKKLIEMQNEIGSPLIGKYFCRKEWGNYKKFGKIVSTRIYLNQSNKYCPFTLYITYLNQKNEEKEVPCALYDVANYLEFFDDENEMKLYIELKE